MVGKRTESVYPSSQRIHAVATHLIIVFLCKETILYLMQMEAVHDRLAMLFATLAFPEFLLKYIAIKPYFSYN